MSKDWLEEAEKVYSYYFSTWNKEESDKYAESFIRYFGEYLIEQAERVEVLEREHSEFKTRFRSMQIKHGIAKDRRNEYFNKNLNLESENKRYREAIGKARVMAKYGDEYKSERILEILTEALEGESNE